MLSIGARLHFPIAKPSFLLQQHQLHDPSPPVRFLSVSSTSQNQTQCEVNEQSLNVSYLVNSCGLSLDSAVHACKRIRLVNLENSEAVIHLLKTRGFSLTQISYMIRRLPSMLLSKPDRTLLPKLNYLYSVGASEGDVVKIFSKSPGIFKRSLEKHIIPTFELLRDVVGSDKKAIDAIKSYPWLLYEDLDKNFIPNITTLLDLKVPESGISYLLRRWPSTLLLPSLNFVKLVEKVKNFGFNPSSAMFVVAMRNISSMSRATWDKKVKVFRRWGWSKEITHEAFRKNPFCLALSEDKINAAMHFFVHKAGIEASYIARFPLLLGLSLENRVIPRYTITQVLLSRGVMKISNFSLNTLLIISNQEFKEKFVIPYLREAPELMDIYQAKTTIK